LLLLPLEQQVTVFCRNTSSMLRCAASPAVASAAAVVANAARALSLVLLLLVLLLLLVGSATPLAAAAAAATISWHAFLQQLPLHCMLQVPIITYCFTCTKLSTAVSCKRLLLLLIKQRVRQACNIVTRALSKQRVA
jgi:hypothetical protein